MTGGCTSRYTTRDLFGGTTWLSLFVPAPPLYPDRVVLWRAPRSGRRKCCTSTCLRREIQTSCASLQRLALYFVHYPCPLPFREHHLFQLVGHRFIMHHVSSRASLILTALAARIGRALSGAQPLDPCPHGRRCVNRANLTRDWGRYLPEGFPC